MSLRKLLAALTVVSMVLGLVGTSALAAEAEQWDSSAATLQSFGIVSGDENGDLRLTDNINRAELVKVLVAAMGAEDMANLLKGAPSFTDVAADAWYSGYVAFAKNAGLVSGYEDGTFRPDATVTYGEVVTFLARGLGLEPAAGYDWPQSYVKAFEDAGLAVEGLNLSEFANAPAVRGWVFALADSAFRYGGEESVYAALDGEAPELTVDPVAAATEATAITVSGKVSGAVAVYVGDAEVEVAEDGSFSAEVALSVGANEIVVKAVDEYGLTDSETLAVTRNLAPAASIEAEAITVEAGQTVDVAVKVLDENGVEMADAVAEVTGESDLGTFAAGQFTAGEAAGTGTLTLTYGELTAQVPVTVQAGALAKLEVTPSDEFVAPGDLVTFEVKGYDALGNEVSGFEPTFTVDSETALINPSTGNFIASDSGDYTITASVGDVTGSAVVGVFGDVAELKIEGPETVVGNDETVAYFTVYAVDENGNVVSDAEIDVTVDVGEDATLTDADGEAGDPGDIENGMLKFGVVADNLLWGQILDVTVSADDETLELDDVTAELEVLEQVAQGIEIASSAEWLAVNESGNTAEVTFEIVDSEGAQVLEGAWDIEYEISGPAEDESGETEGTLVAVDGVATLTLYSLKGETGTITVTGAVEGLGSATATVKATVAGDPDRLVVEFSDESATVGGVAADGIEVTVTITDSRGVPVAYNGTVDVTVSDMPTGAYLVVDDSDDRVEWDGTDTVTLYFNDADPSDEDNSSGDASDDVSQLSFSFISDKAGDYELSVEDNADALDTVTETVAFTAGAADYVAFDWGSDPMVVGATDPTGKVAVVLYDSDDNEVAKAGVAVTVTAQKYVDGAWNNTDEVTLNGETGEVEVKTNADGQAVIEYEVRPYTGARYQLVLDGGDLNEGLSIVEINVAAATPASVDVEILAPDDDRLSSVKANETGAVKIIATLKDEFGGPVDDSWADYLTFEIEDGEWSMDWTGGTDAQDPQNADEIVGGAAFVIDSDGQYYLRDKDTDELLYAAKAGRLTVKAVVNVNGEEISDSDSIRVRPGDDHHAVVAEADDDVIALSDGKVKAVTLRIADIWGNVKSGDATRYVTFSNIPDNLSVRTASDGANLKDVNDSEGPDVLSIRTSKTIYLLAEDTVPADQKLEINLWSDESATQLLGTIEYTIEVD